MGQIRLSAFVLCMHYNYSFSLFLSFTSSDLEEPSCSILQLLVLKGNQQILQVTQNSLSQAMPVKFQKEHTFACFISSSAISIRFLRNAAILFCLKLISSVGKKEQR